MFSLSSTMGLDGRGVIKDKGHETGFRKQCQSYILGSTYNGHLRSPSLLCEILPVYVNADRDTVV